MSTTVVANKVIVKSALPEKPCREEYIEVEPNVVLHVAETDKFNRELIKFARLN